MYWMYVYIIIYWVSTIVVDEYTFREILAVLVMTYLVKLDPNLLTLVVLVIMLTWLTLVVFVMGCRCIRKLEIVEV